MPGRQPAAGLGGGSGRSLGSGLTGADHHGREDRVRRRPRLLGLGVEQLAEPDPERIDERDADGLEVLRVHAVRGVAAAERLDGRNKILEPIDSADDDGGLP